MPGDYAAPCWLLRQARQLLYPRRCPFCRRVLGFVPTCPECAERLEPLRRMPMRLKESEHYLGTLSGAAAPYRYTGCVRSAVLRAKYQGEPWTAVELGVEMARLLFGSEILMRGAEPTPQRVEGLSRRSIREKLLCYFGLQTGGDDCGSFHLPFTLSALADYISADRSAMMRELRKMKEEHLVDIDRGQVTLHHALA